MMTMCRRRVLGVLLTALALLPLAPPRRASAQELSPDEAAMLVLNGARRAYNDQKYEFAAERFREFLRLYAGHKEAVSANYGLALALIEGPSRDYAGAAAALGPVAAREDFADRPSALHYLGAAQRGLGQQSLAQADARPAEAAGLRTAARQQFDEAAKNFAAAAAAFAARAKTRPAPLTAADLESSARARCDQAEMLLRVDKFKEGADLAAAFLADPAAAKSPLRELALYYLGHAQFAQRDYLAAGRSLSQLAPFRQEFGLHARYLLGRAHHLSNARPEAAAQYKAVPAAYDQQKQAAQAALQNPAALRPEQKAAFEALLRNPPPDFVLRASFYAALLQAEDGRFADALAGFTALVQQYPKSSLAAEAQLRQGFCQMQLRNYAEALKSLQPLCEHPQLGDQALWWLARSQAGAADANNAPAYAAALNGALDSLRRAADRAGQLAKTDPDAKVRRGDILLDLGDTQQLAKQFKEAAATYLLALTENNNPDRAEEATQRHATALHLAGLYKESDDVCRRFETSYPKSTLLPMVLFRAAENAYLSAVAAAAVPALPNRDAELARLFGEAVARYQRLLKDRPDLPYINLARQGLGASLCRLGRYADAAAALASIPEPDRAGESATVPYLLADCLIRSLPAEADDALGAARVIEQAERAAKLLESFAAAQPKSPQAPDALLKLAHCYQRIGSLLADPAERQKTLALGRDACERFLQQFPQDLSAPVVIFERAKCLAPLGNAPAAIAELNRFRADPLRSASVAPLALVRLSALLRSQNKPADAAALMAECRAAHEANLLKDPARSDWAAMLQYEHALALKEAGKLAEARALFEGTTNQFAGRREAVDALWRADQCRREELASALAAARATLVKPGAKPEEIAAARAAIDAGVKALGKTIESLEAQAADLGKKAPGSAAHVRALYETAWSYRVLGDVEIDAARAKMQEAAAEKLRARLARESPAALPPPPVRAPEVPASAVPLQPAERAACERYARLIAAAPGAHLATQARLELADLRFQRADDRKAALELLSDALEANPPLELAERARLQAAVVLLAGGDTKAALRQLQGVARNPATPFAAEARYLTGETSLRDRDWPKAVEHLLPFRDQPPLQNVPGVTDRALLRLGFAYAQAAQWDPSRATLDALIQRFPQSTWIDEARCQLGWAWQNMKQFDNAIANYAEVTRRTVSEHAARAQLRTGLCRMEQKNYPEAVKALLVVPFTYDYPELSAQALCHAAQAYVELKRPADAAGLWRKVVAEYPSSTWAKIAAQALAGVK